MQKTKMKLDDLSRLLAYVENSKLAFCIEGNEVRVIKCEDPEGPVDNEWLATWDPQELLVQALQKLGVYAEIV